MAVQELPGLRQFIHCEPKACVGCGLCVYACADEKLGHYEVARSRIRLARKEPHDRAPLALTLSCRACADVPCVVACRSEGSLVINPETGMPHVRPQACTGCGWCVPACRFGVIAVNPVTKVVEICDLCEGRKGGPACIQVCPKDALSVATRAVVSQRCREMTPEKRADELGRSHIGTTG